MRASVRACVRVNGLSSDVVAFAIEDNIRIRPSCCVVRRIQALSSDRHRRRRFLAYELASDVHGWAADVRSTPTTEAEPCPALIRTSEVDARPCGYPTVRRRRTRLLGHRNRPTAASVTPVECFCGSCVG